MRLEARFGTFFCECCSMTSASRFRPFRRSSAGLGAGATSTTTGGTFASKSFVANLKTYGVLTSTPLVHRGRVLSGNHCVEAAIEAGIVGAEIIEIVSELDERALAIELSHNALLEARSELEEVLGPHRRRLCERQGVRHLKTSYTACCVSSQVSALNLRASDWQARTWLGAFERNLTARPSPVISTERATEVTRESRLVHDRGSGDGLRDGAFDERATLHSPRNLAVHRRAQHDNRFGPVHDKALADDAADPAPDGAFHEAARAVVESSIGSRIGSVGQIG